MATETQNKAEIEAAGIAAYEKSIKEHSVSDTQEKLSMRRIFRKQEGFTVTPPEDLEPMERLDTEAIKEKIFALVSEEAIVSTAAEQEELPIQRKKLTSRLLDRWPSYGSDEWYSLDELEREGWELAERQIWKLLDHKYGATLQRWTRERLGEGHVFIRTKDSVFITAETKVIKYQILQKETDKAEKLMRTIGEQYGLFGRQHPALQPGAVSSLKALNARAGKKMLAAYTLKAENGSNDAEGDEK
jgi:hypothetical protein